MSDEDSAEKNLLKKQILASHRSEDRQKGPSPSDHSAPALNPLHLLKMFVEKSRRGKSKH